MRIDRLLWFLRFTKSRSLAQKWVEIGHIRRNGTRVERLNQQIALGDVLTLPLRNRVLVIEILSLPERRGPAEEARTCYRELGAPKLEGQNQAGLGLERPGLTPGRQSP